MASIDPNTRAATGDDHQALLAATTAAFNTGMHVVCDDTNLVDENVQALVRFADRAGADVEVWDLTDVPVDVCIARDHQRGLTGGAHIGAQTIRAMHDEYRAAHHIPAPPTNPGIGAPPPVRSV